MSGRPRGEGFWCSGIHFTPRHLIMRTGAVGSFEEGRREHPLNVASQERLSAKSECRTSLAGDYFGQKHPLFLAVSPQPPSMPRGGRGSSQLTSAWRPSARRSRSCARSGKGCSRGSWPSSSTTVMSMGSPWRMTTSESCPQPALPSPWHCWPRKSRIFYFFPPKNAKHFPPRHPRLSLWPGGCS